MLAQAREIESLAVNRLHTELCGENEGECRQRWFSSLTAGISFTSLCFFFSSRRRHTRLQGDWSSDVCSSDLRDRRPRSCWCRSSRRRACSTSNRRGSFRRRHHRSPWDCSPHPDSSSPYFHWEIGRASCRERV